jgi:hypothetical protein
MASSLFESLFLLFPHPLLHDDLILLPHHFSGPLLKILKFLALSLISEQVHLAPSGHVLAPSLHLSYKLSLFLLFYAFNVRVSEHLLATSHNLIDDPCIVQTLIHLLANQSLQLLLELLVLRP